MGRALFPPSAGLLVLLSLTILPSFPARAQDFPPGAVPAPMPGAEEGIGDVIPPGAVAPQPEAIPAPRPAAPPPFEAAQPLASLALESAVPAELADACARGKGKIWDEGVHFECLPTSLLWRVPWANQREPRMAARVNNALEQSTIDTSIGAEFGMVRLAPDCPFEGFQADIFAVVFTRFDGSKLMASDYRAGIPITFAKGPWQARLAYEHTSSHVGDEFLDANPGVRLPSFTRDEVTIGAGYFLTEWLRAYAVVGVAFGKRRPPGGRGRTFGGLEWSRPLAGKLSGQPFAAVDLDFRPEHDHEPNLSGQAGWLWQNPDSRHAVRVALEYYNGRSPYGAFFQSEEDWVGIAIQYDW